MSHIIKIHVGLVSKTAGDTDNDKDCLAENSFSWDLHFAWKKDKPK